MHIGLQVIRFDWEGGPQTIGTKVSEIGRIADQYNFYSLWVMDHCFQMGGIFGDPEAPMLEGYSTLAYLAAVTQQIKLGTLVTGYLYRYPGILGKTITTLDVLSRGRAYLGIGAGWYEREALGLGVPFPSVRVRFEQLEETLRVIKHMWGQNTSPYHGTHYQLEEPINQPPTIQTPHPPILIGSEGEKKGLRLVAEYGNACNLYVGAAIPEWIESHYQRYLNSIAHLRHKWNVLLEHCADVGRDPAEIEFTVLGTIKPSRKGDGNSPEELIDFCGRLSEVGVTHVIVNIPNVHDIEPLEILGTDVIPVVQKL